MRPANLKEILLRASASSSTSQKIFSNWTFSRAAMLIASIRSLDGIKSGADVTSHREQIFCIETCLIISSSDSLYCCSAGWIGTFTSCFVSFFSSKDLSSKVISSYSTTSIASFFSITAATSFFSISVTASFFSTTATASFFCMKSLSEGFSSFAVFSPITSISTFAALLGPKASYSRACRSACGFMLILSSIALLSLTRRGFPYSRCSAHS